MIKAPILLQDLRRRIYVKAKADTFCGFRSRKLQDFCWRRWSRYWAVRHLAAVRWPLGSTTFPKVAPAR